MPFIYTCLQNLHRAMLNIPVTNAICGDYFLLLVEFEIKT